jgi:hypothetical protein
MTQTIHLQEIGRVAAKPAKDFTVGDFAVWNAGFTSEVISIAPKGRTQITWQVRTKDGKTWDRVVKADRLVAYTDHHWR